MAFKGLHGSGKESGTLNSSLIFYLKFTYIYKNEKSSSKILPRVKLTQIMVFILTSNYVTQTHSAKTFCGQLNQSYMQVPQNRFYQ